MPDINAQSTKQDLLTKAGLFCAREDVALSTLARVVVNDGKFFARLNRGGDCTTGAYDRFMAHFEAHGGVPTVAEDAAA